MDRLNEDDVEVPSALAGMRRYALDDALLLFDRRTGLTAICDGPETVGLRMRAPQTLPFASVSKLSAWVRASTSAPARAARRASSRSKILRLTIRVSSDGRTVRAPAALQNAKREMRASIHFESRSM